MGKETDAFLASSFADSFKREIDGDEAVWRSLPFFAAIMGLAVSVLPTGLAAVLKQPRGLSFFLSASLFGLAIVSFAIAGVYFWAVIRLRTYRYPPTDREILTYAEAMKVYFGSQGDHGDALDLKVRDEVRALMIEELAEASTTNRINNSAKAKARSQVLLFVMLGFLMAFGGEAIILFAHAAA